LLRIRWEKRSDDTVGSGPRKYAPKLVKVEMIFKKSRVELHHNMLKMLSLKAILRLITSPRVWLQFLQLGITEDTKSLNTRAFTDVL
jgi:hypothetical protein